MHCGAADCRAYAHQRVPVLSFPHALGLFPGICTFPQGLGEKWAIRRVLQAVVEAGQFDVAKALVDSSMQHEEGMSEGEGRGEWASGRRSNAAEVRPDE